MIQQNLVKNIILPALFLALTFFLISAKDSLAFHCVGTYDVYTMGCQDGFACQNRTVNNPEPPPITFIRQYCAPEGNFNCTNGCCSSHYVCAGNVNAIQRGLQCVHLSDGTCGPNPGHPCGIAFNGCSAVATPPPPGVTPTPGPGGGGNSCTGSCFSGIPNCGAVGRVGGGGSCSNPGDLCCAAPNQPRQCNFGMLPNPAIITIGQITRLEPQNIRVVGGGAIGSFTYATVPAGLASFNPQPRANCAFNPNRGYVECRPPSGGWGTNATGLISSNGMISSGLRVSCGVIDHGTTTRYYDLNVIPQPPAPGWWQAVDGDVLSQGDLTSRVPTGAQRFILPGVGTYPGLALYGLGSTFDFSADSTNTGSPSVRNWLAQSGLGLKRYDYSFFEGLIPTNTVFNQVAGTVNANVFASGGLVSPDGYFWYKGTGDTTISGALALNATRKVIIFVEGGKLTLGGNVTITNPGQGFFMALANGPIDVAPTATTLHGIYLSDGAFSTGVSASQLTVRGSVVSYGGANLQRDLVALNATTPAEVFQFDPTLLFTYPKSLTPQRVVWREVAP